MGGTSANFFRLLVGIVLVQGISLPEVLAEDRPYLYGCGVIWGSWMGLATDQANEFDRRSMDKIVEMGGTNIGGNFAWIDIESQRGSFTWQNADHQVDEAVSRGLQIFAYSGLTPDWALPSSAPQTPGIGYRFPPDEQYAADFENFFRMLASRYCGRVHYYEFWNEPNGCSWINDGCGNGNMASTYVPWLKRWYTAMKQGCADTILSVGGLDCNLGTGSDGCANYIRDVYSSGGGDSFDAVALHPYGNTEDANALNWGAISAVYNVLSEHGQGQKKLWLNEWGYNTADEATKARLVNLVLTELEKPQYEMVSQALYLCITDLPSTPDDGHDYGLCSREKATLSIFPRESYHAFKNHPKIFVHPEEEPALGEDGAILPEDGSSGADGVDAGFEDASIESRLEGGDFSDGAVHEESARAEEENEVHGSCGCFSTGDEMWAALFSVTLLSGLAGLGLKLCRSANRKGE